MVSHDGLERNGIARESYWKYAHNCKKRKHSQRNSTRLWCEIPPNQNIDSSVLKCVKFDMEYFDRFDFKLKFYAEVIYDI